MSDQERKPRTYADLYALYEAAEPWQLPEGEQPKTGKILEHFSDGEDADPGKIHLLSEGVTSQAHFARDAGGKLYVYHNGTFKPHGERHVKWHVKRLCEEYGPEWTRAWSPRLADSVVEYIAIDAPELWERPPLDTINVKNGLLRITDRVLLDHSPDHLSTVHLPVSYDPKATCPAIEQFVAEVFPSDAHMLAWEVAAWLMRPDVSIQKAVLLTGEGSNGKSSWLTLLTNLLGKQNTVAVSLHKLEANTFAAARLIGRLANICPDLPSSHLESTSTFKAIVGNDTLNTEYKHKDSFEFTPFCRLVFSANHPPRSQDASHAFFRRWLVIPFERTIEPSEAIPRDVLDARLSAPSELSGLLNKALDALPRIRERGFSEPASIKAAWQDFHATTDPLAVWLDRYTIDDPGAFVPKQVLRTAYGADCERHGRPAPSAKAFGQSLYRLRSDVTEAQRTIGGKSNVWCYVGIGLTHPEDETEAPPEEGNSQRKQRNQRDSSLFDSQTCGKQEKKGTEHKRHEKGPGGLQSRENTVDSVDPVGSDLCLDCLVPLTHTPTSDGFINRHCEECGRAFTCVKAGD